jgi:hypothetical protein
MMAYQIGEGCLNGCLKDRWCLMQWEPCLFPNAGLSVYSELLNGVDGNLEYGYASIARIIRHSKIANTSTTLTGPHALHVSA